MSEIKCSAEITQKIRNNLIDVITELNEQEIREVLNDLILEENNIEITLSINDSIYNLIERSTYWKMLRERVDKNE